MGLKEELAQLKNSKLLVEMPTAETPGPAKPVERDEDAQHSKAFAQPAPAAAREKTDLPSSATQAEKTPAKTIPVIAQEILREAEERKRNTAGALPEMSQKNLKPAGPVLNEDKVLLPLPFGFPGERKSIPAIAEQIIAESQRNGEPSPSKPLEEMTEAPEAREAGGGAKTETKEAAMGETEGEEGAPRKTLPAIAEEIRKEMKEGEKREPELPEPPSPPYATSAVPTQMVDRLAEAKQKSASPEPKRLYLLKPEERGGKKEEKAVPSQHRRLYEQAHRGRQAPAESSEPPGFDDMVSEVYVQVKKEEEKEKPIAAQEKREEIKSERKRLEDDARKQFEERRKQREARRLAGQPKKEEAAAPPQSISIEELLGGKPGQQAKASGMFGELEKEVSGGEEEKGKSLFAELDETAKPSAAKKQAEFTIVDKAKGCPNCKNTATKIVYCPYCGGAMCANCATQITPYPDHFTYVCPHCAEEVEVKKAA